MEESKRALLSKNFLGTMLLCTVVLGLGSEYPDFTKPIAANTHITMLLAALKSDIVILMVPILAVLPYTTVFTEEVRSGYAKFYLLRTNRRKYLSGKILGAWISGAGVMAGGMALMLFLFWLILGPMEAASADGGGIIGKFVDAGIRLSIVGGLCAMMGAFLSAMVMSNYMAYIAPFVIWFLLIMLSERYFPACYTMYPKEWIMPTHDWGEGGMGLLWFLAACTALLIILCFQKMKERLTDV